MNFRSKIAGASSFAHLAGFSRAKSKVAKAEDERKDDEETARAEDDDDTDGDDDDKSSSKSKAKSKARAEDEDDTSDDGDDSRAEDDEDDNGDDKPSSKSKAKSKAKAEDEDDTDGKDDEDAEMRGKSPIARARARERSRCATIFASPAAAKNPALAANLAFKTKLGRHEALDVLRDSVSAHASSDRASRNPRLGPGGESGPTGEKAIANSWDAAHARVKR